MAETMERETKTTTAERREEVRIFAERALKITRSGAEPEKNAIFLAGLIEGYKFQGEIESLESRKRAMA